jgi:dTDP-4-dehydrorhamnose reductase
MELVGLPFGPKSRVILTHINQRAILTQSSYIEVGETFTGFIRTVLKLDTMGRNLRAAKDQLARPLFLLRRWPTHL